MSQRFRLKPLLLGLFMVLVIGIMGMNFGEYSKLFLGGYGVPAFCLAFIIGVSLKWTMSIVGGNQIFDIHTMKGICGLLTDLIVVSGIASIKLPMVFFYFWPLFWLFIIGVMLSFAIFRFLGPKTFQSHWFERSIFIWGLSLGVMAIAIALLRMVDVADRSKTLSYFAAAYLIVLPIEIACLVLFPVFLSRGDFVSFTLFCFIGASAALGVTYLNRNRPSQKT